MSQTSCFSPEEGFVRSCWISAVSVFGCPWVARASARLPAPAQVRSEVNRGLSSEALAQQPAMHCSFSVDGAVTIVAPSPVGLTSIGTATGSPRRSSSKARSARIM